MFYGKYKVNKLTFKPLKWAAFGMIFKFCGSLTFLLNAKRFAYFYDNCPDKVLASYAGKVITIFEFLDLYGYLQFINAISFEQNVLWSFILF
jgi:hypothetical protein